MELQYIGFLIPLDIPEASYQVELRTLSRGTPPKEERRCDTMAAMYILPCLDSAQMAASRRQELSIPTDVAVELGRSAVEAARNGFYITRDGQEVDWRDAVQAACAAKRSIAPDVALPTNERAAFTETRFQVTNETTFGASRRLVERGLHPLALNFANGLHPGGGFLSGGLH